MEVVETRIDAACPVCRYEMRAIGCAGHCPKPGDLTLCVQCTTLLEFTDGLELSVMPEDKASELPSMVLKAVEALRKKIAEDRSAGAMN